MYDVILLINDEPPGFAENLPMADIKEALELTPGMVGFLESNEVGAAAGIALVSGPKYMVAFVIKRA